MPQDPIHAFSDVLNTSASANNLLALLRNALLSAGFVVQEYDTTPDIDSQNGGHELYFRTASTGHTVQSFYSLKAVKGSTSDHSGILIYENVGYDSSRRVDNQPGMFARHQNDVLHGVPWTQVFAGLWDGAGINADPADHGLYKSFDGSPPAVDPSVPHWHSKRTSQLDRVSFFWSLNGAGAADGRVLIMLWYVENQLYGLAFGKVYYDTELVFPTVEGCLLAGWCNKFTDRATTNPPTNNSIAGERTSGVAGENPFAIIRNRTAGAETWPAGTPNGTPLASVGGVVLSAGRLEASDGFNDANISAIRRPDMRFDSTHNTLQGDAFPDPALTIHYEALAGSQNRRGMSRQRNISRWPNGGALLGDFARGEGVTDWADSRFGLPWYYAPAAGELDGAIIVGGSRRYRVFPGNRQGTNLFASHRWGAIGIRISDI